MRDYLGRQKVRGRNIEFHEGRGFVKRSFTVSGDAEAVRPLYGMLPRLFFGMGSLNLVSGNTQT